MEHGNKDKRMRIGWWVFLGLALVTGLEFWLSNAAQGTLGYLTLTAIVKAGLIIYYFMHVSQAWPGEARRE